MSPPDFVSQERTVGSSLIPLFGYGTIPAFSQWGYFSAALLAHYRDGVVDFTVAREEEKKERKQEIPITFTLIMLGGKKNNKLFI